MVKQNGSNTQSLLQELVCEECVEIVNLKLASYEENLSGKENIIQLLKEQLRLLTDRNIKSINEAQNIGYKYSLAKQELETVSHVCAKVVVLGRVTRAALSSHLWGRQLNCLVFVVLQYEEELHKFRLEKANKEERDELTLRFKEDADRWKKQFSK